MSQERRPGTISPGAKQMMASAAAILGVLINVGVFVGSSRHHWSYSPSRDTSTGPRIVLLGAEGREIPAAGTTKARLGRPVPMAVLELELDLEPQAEKSDAPARSPRNRDWATAYDWTPAEVWRRERLRPDLE